MKSGSSKLTDTALRHFPLLLIFTASALLSREYLTKEFWYDEAYTLMNLVWQGPLGVFTDYSAPNNHMVFTSSLSLWLMACEALQLADWALRILPWSYSLLSVLLLYFFVNKLAGRESAIWAAALWGTAHSFLNFSCQVRGYPMSACVLCLAAWLLLPRTGKPSLLALAAFALTAILAVGILPTNLLLLEALSFWAVYCMWNECRLRRAGDRMTAGIILFAPILGMTWYFWNSKVRNDFFLHARGSHQTLAHILHVYQDIGSAVALDSLIVLPLVFLGLIQISRRKSVIQNRGMIVSLAILSLAPLSAAIIKTPFARNFFPMVPIWFGLLGILAQHGCEAAGRKFAGLRNAFRVLVPLILVLAIVRESLFPGFYQQKFAGKHPQNLYFQYYQVNFHPSRIIAQLLQLQDRGEIVAFTDKSDWMALKFYAHLRQFPGMVSANYPNSPEEFRAAYLRHAKLYVVSNSLENATSTVKRLYRNHAPAFRLRREADTGFFQLFEMKIIEARSHPTRPL